MVVERAARASAADVAFLLVAPVLVVLALRVRPMAPLDMIDPAFYSAYGQHGRDLVLRYGPTNYYWVRLGFILPASVADELFGHVGGFYVLRYVFALVATVPVHLLFLRTAGRRAAVLASLVVLTAPVLLSSWATDYPDSSGVSYMAAGLACLAMPSARRLGWVVAAGAALTLALHSQIVAAPVVGPTVAVFLALRWFDDRRAAVREAVALAVAALVVTGGLAAVSRAWLDNANILGPTWRQIGVSRRETHLWHTDGLGWMLNVAYLLVPWVVLGAWWITRWGRLRALARPELLVGLVATAQFLVMFAYQAVGEQATLEYHLYSTMAWPALLLCLAFVLHEPAPDRPAGARGWVVVGAVVAVPLLLGVVRPPSMGWGDGGLLVAVAALGAAALTRLPVARRAAPLDTAVACLLVLAVGVLTVTRIPDYDKREGSVPHGTYDRVLNRDAEAELARYRIAADLPDFVGMGEPGDVLLLWWDRDEVELLNPVAGQYLWELNGLPSSLPALGPADVDLLRRRKPVELLLLDRDDRAFPRAVDRLRAAGCDPSEGRSTVLRSGDVEVAARLLVPNCP